MKEIGKRVLKYIIIYVSIIITFLLLLTGVSLIPKSKIEKNVKETAETLTEQTNRYEIPIRNWYMLFDNYTDALMVNTAYSIDNKNPFYSAMVARKNYIPGVTEEIYPDRTGGIGRASKYQDLDQVGELNDTIKGIKNESFEYARYWHGYLVLLRPALVFFNVTQIRNIMTVVFTLLLMILIILLIKNVNYLSAIAVTARNIGNRLFIFRSNHARNSCIFDCNDIKYNYCF